MKSLIRDYFKSTPKQENIIEDLFGLSILLKNNNPTTDKINEEVVDTVTEMYFPNCKDEFLLNQYKLYLIYYMSFILSLELPKKLDIVIESGDNEQMECDNLSQLAPDFFKDKEYDEEFLKMLDVEVKDVD